MRFINLFGLNNVFKSYCNSISHLLSLNHFRYIT